MAKFLSQSLSCKSSMLDVISQFTETQTIPIGIECHGDRMIIMVKKGQKYPCAFQQTFQTVQDNQTCMSINVR